LGGDLPPPFTLMPLTEAENEALSKFMTREDMLAWLKAKNMTIEDLERYRVHKGQLKGAMKRDPLTDTPLHVITPVTRPHNLQKIADSIANADHPHRFSIHWHIIFKNHENRYNVIQLYNKLLDSIQDGWFTFMCDDNSFHPRLFTEFQEAIDENPNMGVYLVSIFARHGVNIEARPEAIRPFGVDAAQTFIKREILGDTRYSTHNVRYTDSQIVMDLYKKCPEKFVFTDKVLAYFERIIRDDNGNLFHEEDGIIQ